MMKLITTHTFTFDVNVNIPQLADLLAVLGGRTIADTLSQIEAQMAQSFAELMEEIRVATQEIKDQKTAADAAEVQEDADAAARDQANADKIAELQAQIDSGTLSQAQKDQAAAAIAALREAAGVGTPATEPPTEEPPTAPEA